MFDNWSLFIRESTTMAVGVWNPEESEHKTVDTGLLKRFLVVDPGTGGIQEADLESAGVDAENGIMKLDASAWQSAEALQTEEIVRLVRIFTLVESQVPGWDAGPKSPVIPLVKLLKKRDGFTPELRKWIKANTDNRYLPYGSAL